MDAIQEYFRLRDKLDAEIDHLSRIHRPLLLCRPGCSTCCIELSLLPIEAETIRRACGRLPEEQGQLLHRRSGIGTDCPFLHHRRCLVYPARPIICRTHGLPIAYVDQERQEIQVSACPRNFPPEYEFAREELLFLDPFNETLALLNSQLPSPFLKGKPARIAMRDILPEPAEKPPFPPP